VARRLLHAGALVGTRDTRGLTALHYAELKGRAEVATLLSSPTGSTSLSSCVSDEGASETYSDFGNSSTSASSSHSTSSMRNEFVLPEGMLSAVHNNDVAAVQHFLGCGGHVDAVDPQLGGTMLIRAASAGLGMMIDALLDAHASVHKRDDNGCTALCAACFSMKEPAVQTLLAAKADPNIQDNMGMSPLMVAALHGHMTLVRRLLNYDARRDLRDVQGCTALMYAESKGHTAAAKLLRSSAKSPVLSARVFSSVPVVTPEQEQRAAAAAAALLASEELERRLRRDEAPAAAKMLGKSKKKVRKKPLCSARGSPLSGTPPGMRWGSAPPERPQRQSNAEAEAAASAEGFASAPDFSAHAAVAALASARAVRSAGAEVAGLACVGEICASSAGSGQLDDGEWGEAQISVRDGPGGPIFNHSSLAQLSLSEAPAAASTAPASAVGHCNNRSLDMGVDEIPCSFICPITQEIMVDPVTTCDGHTYDRVAISSWLSRRATSPLTSEPLEHTVLVANKLVRSMIIEFAEANPELPPCAALLAKCGQQL